MPRPRAAELRSALVAALLLATPAFAAGPEPGFVSHCRAYSTDPSVTRQCPRFVLKRDAEHLRKLPDPRTPASDAKVPVEPSSRGVTPRRGS